MPDTPVSWRERFAASPLATAVQARSPRLLATAVQARSPRLLAAALAAGGLAVGAAIAVVALGGAPVAPELTLPRAAPPAAAGPGATPGGRAPSATAGSDAGATADGGAAPEAGGAPAEAEPGSYVHAAGAVARPGVYRVRAGGRVSDVLDAAGGPAGDADLDQVNLAAKVTDGERVYVPRRGQAVPLVVAGGSGGTGAGGTGAGGTGTGAGGTRAGAAPGPVDLNTATLDQLDALPGVGPATAQAILDYRAEHGRFAQVQELLEVRGIGEAKLAAIRPRVRV